MNIHRLLAYPRTLLGILDGSRAWGGPLQANINITNRCNLRCVHCYYYSPHVRLPNFVKARQQRQAATPLTPEELAVRLQKQTDARRLLPAIDALLASGTRRFQLSGYGEIFVHPDILAIFDRAKRGNAYVLTNTNGILLNADTVDALIDMHFDDLRVSVMAGSPEVYARTHFGVAPSLFARLKENLAYLAERKQMLAASRPKVRLAVVIIRDNVEDLVNVARLAVEIKAMQVIYRGFDDVGDDALTPLAPTSEQLPIIYRQLQEAAQYLDSHGVRHNVANMLGVFKQAFDTSALYRVVPCYYGWLTIGVDVDGEVYPCTRCNESMGNLFEQGLDAIWHGEKYRRFRAQAKALPVRTTPIDGCDCSHCGYHNANLRLYRLLHPWSGHRLKELKLISSEPGE